MTLPQASHGWNDVSAQQKRALVEALCTGGATRGPVHAELDLTDRCNVACYFCNQQDVRTREQLPLAQVQALLDELVASGLRSVRLSGGGDPLFHRQILEVLDSLTARGVVIDNLTTNAVRLTPEVATRLLENGCREVVVSLNAVDPADYHRMMKVKPATFDTVLENVRHLLTARAERGPRVVLQFLFDRANVMRLVDMYELGLGLVVDQVAINPVLDIPLERITEDRLLQPEDGERLRPLLETLLRRDREVGKLQISFPYAPWNAMAEEIRTQLEAPAHTPYPSAPSFRERDNHCFFAWHTVTVRGNGDVYPCCMLMNPSYEPLGNVKEGSLLALWHGEAFARLRREMREVFLTAGRLFYRDDRFQHLQPQCVHAHQCGLKSMYFRHDEALYAQLAERMDATRRREVRWLGTARQRRRAAEVLAFRVYHGVRTRWGALRARLSR